MDGRVALTRSRWGLWAILLAGCPTAPPSPDTGGDTRAPPDTANADAASPSGTVSEVLHPCDTGEDLDGDCYDATTDCDESNPEIHPDAPKVCDWVDHDCDGLLDCSSEEAWATIDDGRDSSADLFKLAGDLDGDGVEEISVAGTSSNFGTYSASFSVGSLRRGHSDLVGVRAQGYLYPIGDANGDGLADLALTHAGDPYRWYIWYSDGNLDGRLLTSADASVAVDEEEYGPVGVLGSVDLDGDGEREVRVYSTSFSDYDGDTDACIGFVSPRHLGTPLGTVAAGPGYCFVSEQDGNLQLSYTFSVGDVDGDGLSDQSWVNVGREEVSFGVIAAHDFAIGAARVQLPDYPSVGRCTTCKEPRLYDAGDADRDGLADVVLTDYYSPGDQTVYVLSGAVLGGEFSEEDAWWRVAPEGTEVLDSMSCGSARSATLDGTPVLYVPYSESDAVRDSDGEPAPVVTLFTNLSEVGTFGIGDATWAAIPGRPIWANNPNSVLFHPDANDDGIPDLVLWNRNYFNGITIWSGADLVP